MAMQHGAAMLASTVVLSLALASCAAVPLRRAVQSEPSPSPAFADLPAEQIHRTAYDAMKGLTSLRVEGTVSGLRMAPIDIDLVMVRDRCRGELDIDGATVSVVRVPAGSYLRADRAFWRLSAGLTEKRGDLEAELRARHLAGRWVKVPDNGRLAAGCDLKGQLELLEPKGGADVAGVRKGMVMTLADRQLIQLLHDDGSALLVDIQPPHRIHKITGSNGGGVLSYSDFDAKVIITPPRPGEFVDMTTADGLDV